MQKPIDVSLIIVAWNSEAWLRRCLRSVFAKTSELAVEVIVVDNASSDRSVQVAMNEFTGVNIVQNMANLGFAAAVNQGLAVASGRYVCLLNPDTEVTDHAIDRMVEAMDRDASIGVLGAHMLNEDGTTQASVRRFPTGLDQTLILSKLHLLFPDAAALGKYLHRGFDYRKTQDVDQVMGACFMIRREVIDQVGLFDETFFIWFEEVDYCRRVAQVGLEVWYCADAEIIHHGGQSFGQANTFKKQWLFFRSALQYVMKS